MKIRYMIFIFAIFLILGIVGIAGATESDNGQGLPDGGNVAMQDSGGDESGGSTTPETPTTPPVTPGNLGDFASAMPGMQTTEVDTNLQNALAGYADYEVTYDTSISHAENTPPELRDLGETFIEKDDPTSEAGQKALALEGFDLLSILDNKYERVEDKYAADPETDFAPDDPDRTLNYYEPRVDPFMQTRLIPDELRVQAEGTGLEGTVDPELLRLLGQAIIEANLRVIPISVIGVIQIGSQRACMYSIGGWSTETIWEGETQGWWGFSVTCSQVTENFVVLTLTSGSAMVVRTFHVTSY
jgi:hypothetical protein